MLDLHRDALLIVLLHVGLRHKCSAEPCCVSVSVALKTECEDERSSPSFSAASVSPSTSLKCQQHTIWICAFKRVFVHMFVLCWRFIGWTADLGYQCCQLKHPAPVKVPGEDIFPYTSYAEKDIHTNALTHTSRHAVLAAATHCADIIECCCRPLAV